MRRKSCLNHQYRLLIVNCLFSTAKLDGFDNGPTMEIKVEWVNHYALVITITTYDNSLVRNNSQNTVEERKIEADNLKCFTYFFFSLPHTRSHSLFFASWCWFCVSSRYVCTPISMLVKSIWSSHEEFICSAFIRLSGIDKPPYKSYVKFQEAAF